MKPKNYYGLAYSKELKDDPRRDKWLKQLERQGLDETETWNLDVVIACFLVPRLKLFKRKTNCIPEGHTEKKWQKTLDKMINAFEIIANREIYALIEPARWEREVEAGLQLFVKHYHDLWW